MVTGFEQDGQRIQAELARAINRLAEAVEKNNDLLGYALIEKEKRRSTRRLVQAQTRKNRT